MSNDLTAMFNADQRAHMKALAATPAEQLHWCGWYRNERHRHPESHPHPECPADLTCADRIAQSCEACGNAPNPRNGRLTHLAGCTREYRRDHHYACLDLGGEG